MLTLLIRDEENHVTMIGLTVFLLSLCLFNALREGLH